MKWNEMSVFCKVVYVIRLLCTLAYAVIGVLFIAGTLPNLYRLPVAWALWGSIWLSECVIIWSNQRKLAILPLVIAILSLIMTIVACVI